MKRTVIAVGTAFFLVLGVALTALAQSGALAGLLNPLVVKIQQAVPVELTVTAAQDDGSVITSTVPLTVGVDLVIIIQGSQVVSLTADTSETIVAVQALPVGEEMVDASGIPYTLESMDGFVLSAVSGETPKSEKFRLSGELLNEGDSEGHVQIAVTLYDAQGNILDARSTTPALYPLPPGRSSAFIMNPGSVDFADVAVYRIQIAPY
jgi:hypothetical protein